jgi:hypothetical protein
MARVPPPARETPSATLRAETETRPDGHSRAISTSSLLLSFKKEYSSFSEEKEAKRLLSILIAH